MKTFLSVLLYLWELPQNLVGLFLRLVLRDEQKRSVAGVTIYCSNTFRGGISLGSTIILDCEHDFCAKHEHGHQVQSRWLGPLYLFVIGIPSIVWAGLHGTKLFPSAEYDYFSFYTEKWANKLGGVQ